MAQRGDLILTFDVKVMFLRDGRQEGGAASLEQALSSKLARAGCSLLAASHSVCRHQHASGAICLGLRCSGVGDESCWRWPLACSQYPKTLSQEAKDKVRAALG